MEIRKPEKKDKSDEIKYCAGCENEQSFLGGNCFKYRFSNTAAGAKAERNACACNGKSANKGAIPKTNTFEFCLLNEISKGMFKLMDNISYMKIYKEYEQKCPYFRHMIYQSPVCKLSRKVKLAIVLTPPVWLIQMLAALGPMEIIDKEKYFSCYDSALKLSEKQFVSNDNFFGLPEHAGWSFLMDVISGYAILEKRNRRLSYP